MKESQGGTGVLGIELVIIACLNSYRIRHQLVVFVSLLKGEHIICDLPLGPTSPIYDWGGGGVSEPTAGAFPNPPSPSLRSVEEDK